jgi:hypothetical protein
MAGVALAQTTNQQPAAQNPSGMVIQGGYVSTPVTAPTVITPRITLGIASSNPVGATSSAGGLQVGASSAALPTANAQGTVINQAIVSSTGTPSANTTTGVAGPAATVVAPATASGNQANGGVQSSTSAGVSGVQIVTGASSVVVESGTDVAAAARYYRTHPMHATKVYTNDDVNRLSQQGSTGGLSNGTLPASDVSSSSAPASTNSSATMPQTDQSTTTQQAAPPGEQPKSKPAPYTPPATPPQ